MKEIFDNYVETSFDGEEQALFKYKLFEHNYKSLFPDDKQAMILDIGVGRGEMLGCMRNWGYENYNGIDISPSTVAHCGRLGLRCELVDDTAEYLRRHANTYRVITMLDVLEHIPREMAIGLLSAIREALSDDGIAIIQVPNMQAPFAYLHHFNDVTHVVGYVEHSLTQVLLAAGFRKFRFFGLDELCGTGFKITIKRMLRPIFQRLVRYARSINANPDPKILDPVFFAVAKRSA